MGTFVFKFTDVTFQKHSCLIHLPHDCFFENVFQKIKRKKKYLYTQIIRVTLEICTTLDSKHRITITTHFSCGEVGALAFFFSILFYLMHKQTFHQQWLNTQKKIYTRLFCCLCRYIYEYFFSHTKIYRLCLQM